MKIHSDSLYLIGKSHQVCQDYTYHGTANPGLSTEIPYIIVADGCSSAKDTDIGARILAHRARVLLESYSDGGDPFELTYERMGDNIYLGSMTDINRMGLDKEALLSTLMVGFKFGNEIRVHTYGDGIIMAERIDGTVEFVELSFTNNMPYYLAYWNSEKADAEFKEMNSMVTKRFRVYNLELPFNYPSIATFNIADYKSVIISTDGLSSFVDSATHKNIDAVDMLHEMVSFKTCKGEFLKRRVNRIVKDYSNNLTHHHDDLGIAAFYIEDSNG